MNGPDHDSTTRGALINTHRHPRPALRRLTAALVTLGIAGDVLGVAGLLVLGFGYALPLLPLMAIFLAVLLVPLIQLAVMHPAVAVYERGLALQPLVGPRVWLPWDAIRRVEDHTLIRRGKMRDRDQEHFGQLIVADGLPWPFAVIGLAAGLGWRTRAFGISTYSHTDYAALRSAIQRHKRRQ
jgi:hypothetical protein